MNVLASACERGLVTRRELESGLVSLQVTDDTSRVRSLLVRGHVIAFVKRPRLDVVGAGPSAERQALRRAGDADLGPRLLAGADDDLLWLSALPGRRLAAVSQPTAAGFAELADICQGWGAAVAALHRQPAPQSGRPAAELPTRSRTARGPASREPNADLVRQAMESDRALARAVTAVEHGWSDRHWIHGELTAEHVMVDPWPTLQVRFVGFGCAGLGDPGWDLAGCLDTIAELVEPADGARPSSKARLHAQVSMLGDYFLHAYRRAGGPGQVHPAMQAAYALGAARRAALANSGSDPAGARQAVLRQLRRAHEFAAHGAEGLAA